MSSKHPFSYSFTTCFKERVVGDLLEPGVGKRVLEMGCGSGYFATYLASRFSSLQFEYFGIDMSEEAIAVARRYMNGFGRLFKGNVTSMPFDDEEFDDLLYLDVIEHVRDDGASLSEAFRVLKPGGRLVISTPNRSAIFTDTIFCEYMHDHGHMDNMRSGYAEAELSSMLQSAGFLIDRIRYTNVFLSELMITLTKLGYRMLKPKYASQADVVEVSDSVLFKTHKNLFFPIGYALGRAEEKILGSILKGHCLIMLAKKPI